MKIPNWILIGAVVILLILNVYQCTREDEKTTTTITTKPVQVKIPEHTGMIKEPVHSSELPSVVIDTVEIEGETVYLQSPIDEELKTKLQDSENKYALLLDEVRKREYSEDFEDKFVKINVKTSVYGKLDKNEIKYTLLPREVTVNETTIKEETVKYDNGGILTGGGVLYNPSTQKMTYEANAGVRIKKLTFLAGYNTDKQVSGKLLIEL